MKRGMDGGLQEKRIGEGNGGSKRGRKQRIGEGNGGSKRGMEGGREVGRKRGREREGDARFERQS